MIKKNTKIIFQDSSNNTDELIGGVPLTKGETITVKKDEKIKEYEVIEKKTEFIFEGEDQIANIEYVLKEK